MVTENYLHVDMYNESIKELEKILNIFKVMKHIDYSSYMELSIFTDYKCPNCGIDTVTGRYDANTGLIYSCDSCDVILEYETFHIENTGKNNELYFIIKHKKLGELEKIIKVIKDMKYIDNNYLRVDIEVFSNCPNCDYYVYTGYYDTYNGWIYSCEKCGCYFKYNKFFKIMKEIDVRSYKFKFNVTDGVRIFSERS